MASKVLHRHNSERREDNVFQKTGSVTQKVAEVKEDGDEFEKEKKGFMKRETGKFFSTFVYVT